MAVKKFELYFSIDTRITRCITWGAMGIEHFHIEIWNIVKVLETSRDTHRALITSKNSIQPDCGIKVICYSKQEPVWHSVTHYCGLGTFYLIDYNPCVSYFEIHTNPIQSDKLHLLNLGQSVSSPTLLLNIFVFLLFFQSATVLWIGLFEVLISNVTIRIVQEIDNIINSNFNLYLFKFPTNYTLIQNC